MRTDPYLKAIAILVKSGFRLKGEIWDDIPWEGDMPDDMIEAFAYIALDIENERFSKSLKI